MPPSPSRIRRQALAGRSASLAAWASQVQALRGLRDAAERSLALWRDATAILPPTLRSGVQPGRWDDGVWTLTAASSAVAAKLKQLRPQLLRELGARGHPLCEVRIRVHPAAPPPPPPQPLLATPCPEAARQRLAALRRRWLEGR